MRAQHCYARLLYLLRSASELRFSQATRAVAAAAWRSAARVCESRFVYLKNHPRKKIKRKILKMMLQEFLESLQRFLMVWK